MSTPNQEAFAAEVETQQAAAEQSDQVRAAAVEAAAEQAAAERSGRTFSEVEVAAIRKQEKDKLYKQLEERDARLAALEADLTKRQRAEQEEQARLQAEQEAAAEAARKAEEERMTWQERLAQTEKDLQAQIEAERQERLALIAQQEKEREFQAIEAYRAQAVAAAQEDILPQLLNRVTGTTPEEIDASVAELKELSNSIYESANAAFVEQRKNAPGARVTSPGVGPMEINTENKQLSADDIAAMDMQTYAQNRHRFIGSQSTGRGMFG